MYSFNRSSVNLPSTQATFVATTNYSSSSRTNRIPRPRPASHLPSSSSSSADIGWKTSSNIKKDMESWKMSGRPRHAQLQHVDDPVLKRQSATPTMTNNVNSPWQPKPLPQEPSPPVVADPFNPVYSTPFHLNMPLQPPVFINQTTAIAPEYHSYPPSTAPYHISDAMYQTSNVEYPPAMINAVVAPYPPTALDSNYQPPLSNLDYNNYHQPQEYPPYNNMPPLPPQQQFNEQAMYPPSTSLISHTPSPTPINLIDAPPPPPPVSKDNSEPAAANVDDKSNKKKEKPEKKARQITVQSINAEHRVWIDILPSETGLSLAEKIHIIATFRTRKVVSIATASGRKVPLDNRPVFGSWMDMDNFVDGERWIVEWRENDRGVIDRFFAKVVQAGAGRRKDHVKEKD